ncbi:MAG: hypothetical protein DWQ19_09215 [Crenarchaeota archaeon]|nr:MAG: hypothetical protein DWQ19_09215 [Thermoproteota archaeon]
MKAYWSIPGPSKAPRGEHCICFYKFDGSNLRFGWSKKRGWTKFGTRRRMFDEKDPEYGPAIELFFNKHAEGLERVFRDNKNYRGIETAIAFFEYYGPSSFGCYHDFTERFQLSLLDVNILRRGLVLPKDFVRDFGTLEGAAHVIYEGPFTDQLIEDVKENRFGLREGVVAKGVKGNSVHDLWMVKIKTKWWMNELRRRANALDQKDFAQYQRLLDENKREQDDV